MKFYVSWSRSDPFYPSYDKNTCMLISIASISSVWTLDRLPVPPKFLMIDSGAYSMRQFSYQNKSPRDIFKKQLSILGESDIPTILCPLDYPMIDSKLNHIQKDRLLTETIANAYELRNLLEIEHVAKNISAIGIIQGDNAEALKYCARECKGIGFPIYGIGSLSGVYDHKIIVNRIKAVTTVIPPHKLHIFGVSAIDTVRYMKSIGIASFDSSRPIKSAIYNEIYYSSPFRKYYVEIPHRVKDPEIAHNRTLREPLPCDCPVCREDPAQIFGVGRSKFTKKRAIHNYYHMKKEFQN